MYLNLSKKMLRFFVCLYYLISNFVSDTIIVGDYMNKVNTIILFVFAFLIMNSNIVNTNSSLDAFKTLPKSWDIDETNTNLGSATVDSCVGIENLVTYNQVEFEYSVDGDYEDIVFTNNTSNGEISVNGNKVVLYYSKVQNENEKLGDGTSSVAFCYKINLNDASDTTDIHFTNIKLINSKKEVEYQVNDFVDSLKW